MKYLLLKLSLVSLYQRKVFDESTFRGIKDHTKYPEKNIIIGIFKTFTFFICYYFNNQLPKIEEQLKPVRGEGSYDNRF
jgi:hypothetical protein